MSWRTCSIEPRQEASAAESRVTVLATANGVLLPPGGAISGLPRAGPIQVGTLVRTRARTALGATDPYRKRSRVGQGRAWEQSITQAGSLWFGHETPAGRACGAVGRVTEPPRLCVIGPTPGPTRDAIIATDRASENESSVRVEGAHYAQANCGVWVRSLDDPTGVGDDLHGESRGHG